MESIEFQGKRWQVVNKVEGRFISDPSTIKETYRCDLVLKDRDNIFFILREMIDAEFEDII